ncbi:hypothetical protein [Bosea sp. (in: a-proteobacteria)]|uniref:hypothetical protein n=1 Tax=Bosea sp. (in: a-proteobacteria) TaxID=1871050 RepID=UPI003B3BE0F2
MDFGSPPRMAALTATSPLARTDVSAQAGGVAVELPPEKTVQSASAGGAVQLDIRPEAQRRFQQETKPERSETAQRSAADEQARAALQKKVVIEQNTHSVVTQLRDPHTGETVSMVPDEATLKLRLFARALAERQESQNAVPSIERSA